MKKNPYLPKSDKGKDVWLTNFSKGVAEIAVDFGISEDDVKEVQTDAESFNTALLALDALKKTVQQYTAFKNILRDGPIGTPLNKPTLPELKEIKSVSAIFPRIAKLVQIIKNHKKYNVSIGEKLGIIGAEQTIDPTQMKPTLQGEQTLLGILIKWLKGFADGVNIYVDRKDGKGFIFLATDTEPDYLDTVSIKEEGVKSAVWDYYATYFIGSPDDEVGKPSDVISVTVVKR